MLIPSHPVPILNSPNLYGLNSLGISIHHGNPTRGWTFSGINPMTFLEPKKPNKYTKYLPKINVPQSLVDFPLGESAKSWSPEQYSEFLRPSPGLTGKQTQPYPLVNQQNYGESPFSIAGWWYTYPSEKYEFVSWDDEIPNIWENLFQTTNQLS